MEYVHLVLGGLRISTKKKRQKPFDPPQQELPIAAGSSFLTHASRPYGAIDNRAREEAKDRSCQLIDQGKTTDRESNANITPSPPI
jgi:hypothetical protein